ncbi:cadherin-like protein [Fontibacillus phaseoli]|uniref:Cadherin-like protein n=1 Tax=Fontibacillus phaseoli TaxID=1416533 RepID=A0A369B4J8_9BACL|nr:FG-GAP-like repeat-containing protein [Fontibacillus phaseoli]RCX16472.1 cadherin-like protein [Fontibacillus phaseoli]
MRLRLHKKRIGLVSLLTVVLGVSLLLPMAAPQTAKAAQRPLFHEAVRHDIGGILYSAAVEDVNRDGKKDIIAINVPEKIMSVLLGNGDGTFRNGSQSPVGSLPRKVAFADFNGDGAVDAAVSSSGDNTLSILMGLGDGSFLPETRVLVGAEPIGLVQGDFNGDGNSDLAVANNSSNEVSILLGKGDGTFSTQSLYSVGINPRSLVAEDFNKDGKLDLAVANNSSANISILLGDGNGGFAAISPLSSGRSPIGLQAADFNQDGNLDLAVAANNDNTVNVFLGNGDGTFGPVSTYPLGSLPLDLELGDFDGDGNLDLLGGVQGASVPILFGNGDGTFQPPFSDSYPFAGQVTSGDLNGDGKPDIVTVHAGGYLQVMNSAADGTLNLALDRYEVREDAGSVTVAVYRTGGSYGQAKIRLLTLEGTAAAGRDYSAIDDTLVFDQGETSKQYSIPITNMVGYQGDRSFQVQISTPSNGAVLGTQTVSSVMILEGADLPDTTAPILDASRFGSIDHYSGVNDQLYGDDNAVGEAGTVVRAYLWNDADGDGTVGGGELGAGLVVGISMADGSVPAGDIGDLAPGIYVFVVTATDASGNESELAASAAVSVTLAKGASPEPADTVPPVWPTGAKLDFSGLASSAVTLEWPEASDDTGIEAYEIYQGASRVNSLSAAARSYTVTGLTANVDYTFMVKAVDAAGNGSSDLAGSVRTPPPSGSGAGSGFSETGPITAPALLAKSPESRLKQLSLTAAGTALVMTPPFQADVHDYAALTRGAQVSLSFESLHPLAKVEINGQIVKGKYTADLKAGDNLLEMRIYAEDRTSTTYRLTLTRLPSEEPGTVSPLPFNDVKGHWAHAEMQAAFSMGLVKGDISGTFRPDNDVSRAEWTVMLDRLLKSSRAASSGFFTDNGSIPAWAKEAVDGAAERGLITGYADGTFRPGQSLTRAEIAVILGRVLKWPDDGKVGGNSEAGAVLGGLAFEDDAEIPAWAKGYVRKAVKQGLLQGRGAGRFAPNEQVTRAEAAVLLVRLSRILDVS